jgi:hypothetical protein
VYGRGVSVFIKRLVHETYAAHCILTNVGFLPDEIFVSVQPILNAARRGTYSVVMVKRGDAQFVLTLQPVTDDQAERYLDAWRAFAKAKSTMSRKALDQIVYGSVLYERRLEIITALVARGFELSQGPLN